MTSNKSVNEMTAQELIALAQQRGATRTEIHEALRDDGTPVGAEFAEQYFSPKGKFVSEKRRLHLRIGNYGHVVIAGAGGNTVTITRRGLDAVLDNAAEVRKWVSDNKAECDRREAAAPAARAAREAAKSRA